MHSGRPLVAVKCKLGELDALGNLRSRRDAQVRVMVELLDSTSPSGRLLPSLVRAATSLARFGRTLWLDTTWLTSRSPLIQQPRGVFEYLDACIESAVENEHGLFASHLPSLVPVISLDASNDELRRARRLIEHKYRDIAIRIRYPARSKRDLGKRIESIMRSTGTQPGQVHAVVDAGFIETIQASHVTSTANVAATTLDLLGPGHTTLLAGSIPKVRATYATVLRDRPEVTLWNEIHQDGTRELNYGDYGVTHPTPSMTGGNARSPFPYLCYTVPQRRWYCAVNKRRATCPQSCLPIWSRNSSSGMTSPDQTTRGVTASWRGADTLADERLDLCLDGSPWPPRITSNTYREEQRPTSDFDLFVANWQCFAAIWAV